MRNVARVLAAGTTSLLLVGLVPGAALAVLPTHVVSTSPGDGTRIAGPLSKISVTFDGDTTGTLSVTPPPAAGDFRCPPDAPNPPTPTIISCTPAKTDGFLDGEYSVRVVASVATSPTPTPIDYTFKFTLDTTPPPAPTLLAISPSPYGKAAADAATPFTVSGKSETAGDSVAITLTSSADANTIRTRTVPAGVGGAFTATFDPVAEALADGTLTATARATDAVGNVKATPVGLASTTALKDTVAPTAPTGLVIDPSPYTKADLGSSRSVGVSGAAAAAGESVTVTLVSSEGGDTATATTTAVAGGAFGVSFAPSAVPDGTLTATVRSTDAAGNTSPASTATTARDTLLPAVVSTSPVTTTTAAGSQTSQSSGGAANGFTASANDTLDPSSTIVLKDSSGRAITVTPSVAGSNVSVVPTAGPLAEGSYTATVTLVDDVGNTATPFIRSFTIDDTLPTRPSFLSIPVINVARAGSYTVTGTGEPGATVTVTFTDSTPVTPIALTSPATVTAGGTWSVTRSVATLADGTVSLTASQADGAGNTSVLSSASQTKDTVVPRVSLQNFDQDLYAAATPLLVTVSGKVDNGATTDGEAAKSVTVTVTDGADNSEGGIDSEVGSDGLFSVVVDATSLADGTLTAHVLAIDGADNPSIDQTDTAIKDTGAPATPTVTVTDPVNTATASIVAASGTSEAASTVEVTIDDANNAGSAPVVGHATTNSSGAYAVSPVMDLHLLSDGVLTVTARAADAAGNLSAIRTTTVIKDTRGPAAPDVTFPEYVNAANVAAVPVTGTAESGATVVLLVTDSGSGTVTKTVTATGGAFSTALDLSTLAEGDLTFKATPTDTRDNPGDPFTRLSTKDTVAPGLAAELSASPSPYDLARATADAPLTVTGKDAATDRSASTLRADITLTDTSGSTAPVTELGVPVTVTTGVFSFAFTKAQVLLQADGTLTVSVVLHDLAGNRSSARQTTLVKDVTELAVMSTTPAAAAASSQPVTDVVIATNEALVTGTSPGTSPYSRISVTNGLDNQVLGSIVFLAGDKGMKFTPSSPFTEAGSPYAVTLHAADANDTFDTVDQVTTFTVDTHAPVAPTLTSVTNPVKASNKDAVSVTGNAGEQGAKVTVTVTGVSGSPRVYEATEAERSAANGSYTLQINVSNLPDGALRVSSAFSTDRAGNVGPVSTATLTTTKDATLPVVSSLAATASDFSHPSSSVTGQVSEAVAGSTVSLSATDGTHVVTGSATVLSNRTFATTLGLTSMNAGQVTVTVTAVDAVGNTGTASVVTARDTATPPTAAPTGASAVANDRAATVSFTLVPGAGNGGASITSYTVVITNNATAATSTFPASTSPVRVTGLTNGVLYTFQVRANNRAGGGPMSSASTAVKPMGSSSVTLNALPTKVVKGATIKLTGKLTRTDTSVAPAQVVIRVRTDSGTIATLARVTVSSTGTFAYSYRPSFNRFYSVIYPGDAKGTSSASTARRVLVAAKVTASAPRGARTVNQVITGGVSPNKRGKTVTLYRVSSTGSRVKLATTTLSSTSTYRFSVRLRAGYTTLMVAIGTTPNNASGFVRFRAYRT